MSKQNKLINEYRQSRKEKEDFQLTNTISLAADMLFKLEAGAYTPEQEPGVWEMVEILIRKYADGKKRKEIPQDTRNAKWTAEYSLIQGAFHVDRLDITIKENMGKVSGLRNNDYLIFGIYPTFEAAHDACTQMRKIHGRSRQDD